RQAMTAARRLAGAGRTGTHDLLVALAREENGLAAKVLRSFGLTPEGIEARIDEVGLAGTSDAPVALGSVRIDLGEGLHIDLSAEAVARLGAPVEPGPVPDDVRATVVRLVETWLSPPAPAG
ncbi:MAG: Clp protease N-terminal domain-containing protein, partial [Acidimicrobiales bacterium]